jgi:hypothetical protein
MKAKKPAWKELYTLKEILAFTAGKTPAEEKTEDWFGSLTRRPDRIPLPNWVEAKLHIVLFQDGSQICVASGIEHTGACSTCAGEAAWVGYYVKEGVDKDKIIS